MPATHVATHADPTADPIWFGAFEDVEWALDNLENAVGLLDKRFERLDRLGGGEQFCELRSRIDALSESLTEITE